MGSVRWKKLAGDLRASWGRIVAMQLALAIALAGVGTVLAARAVLGREITASYRSTHPADATLELAGPVDDALVAAVRARPEVADADRRQMIAARVKLHAGDPWQMLVVFAADDFAALRVNTFEPDTGVWPPGPGTMLVERTALQVMRTEVGATAIIETPHGPPHEIAIAGTAHDAGQAPNWQEHRGVAYVTRAELGALGEEPALHELLVRFQPEPRSLAEVEQRAEVLATWLRARGEVVHEVRVPKLRQHPHQAIMSGVQLVLLVFTLVLLAMCAIVIATLLAAILGRQTREIGVMKAVGASTRQLVGMYAMFVVALGLVGVAIAAPLAYVGAHGMIANIAVMMNITLGDPAIPSWVFAAQLGLGTLVPLAVAGVPIVRAMRVSVRASLAVGGTGFARPAMARLPIVIRNLLRRPGRLALTTTLLVVAGSLVIAAAGVDAGMMAISGKLETARHHDVEIRMHGEFDGGELAAVPGVRAIETWRVHPASIVQPGHDLEVVHTYPDGGHGSFALVGLPPGGSALVSYPVLEGRALGASDREVVLGRGAAVGRHPGEAIVIGIDGARTPYTIVGVVEEIGGASAFVTAAGFARATRDGVALLRIATTAGSRTERATVLAALEAALEARHAPVQYAMPATLLRSIIDDHVVLIVRAVIVMAAILALVGLLGLGSAVAIGVAERTREIGVMKAIGASDGRVVRVIVGEAVAVGAISALLAIAVGIPLTAAIDARLSLIATPPFAIAWGALIVLPIGIVAGSIVAALVPARRAARLSVRAALGEV